MSMIFQLINICLVTGLTALILFSCCHSFSLKCHFQEDVEMKDSTTSQEDDESEDEGLEEVLSGAHSLEQATLILSL